LGFRKSYFCVWKDEGREIRIGRSAGVYMRSLFIHSTGKDVGESLGRKLRDSFLQLSTNSYTYMNIGIYTRESEGYVGLYSTENLHHQPPSTLHNPLPTEMKRLLATARTKNSRQNHDNASN